MKCEHIFCSISKGSIYIFFIVAISGLVSFWWATIGLFFCFQGIFGKGKWMSVFPQPRWPKILGALQHAYDACSFKGRAEMQLRLRSRFSLGFRVGAVKSIQPFSLGEVSNFLTFFQS